MFEQLNTISTAPAPGSGAHYLNETLIEKIWFELDEQATREQVRQTAVEVASQFQDAAVTTFIPIFIYRQTRDKLKRELVGR